MGLLHNRGWHNQCGVKFIGYGVFTTYTHAGGHSTFFKQASFNRNFHCGEATDDLASSPAGNTNPVAWILPQKAGALSSHSLARGSSTATLSLAEGRNLAGSSAGSSTADATLQLVVSMQGTAAGTSTADGNVKAALGMAGSSAGSSTATAAKNALAWISGSAAGSSSASLQSYATGRLEGHVTPYTELSPQSLTDAVWSAMLSEYPDAGTAGNTLSLAGSGGVDYNTLAAAVVAALQADPKTLTVPKFMGLK
jgi:hypothetical protein